MSSPTPQDSRRLAELAALGLHAAASDSRADSAHDPHAERHPGDESAHSADPMQPPSWPLPANLPSFGGSDYLLGDALGSYSTDANGAGSWTEQRVPLHSAPEDGPAAGVASGHYLPDEEPPTALVAATPTVVPATSDPSAGGYPPDTESTEPGQADPNGFAVPPLPRAAVDDGTGPFRGTTLTADTTPAAADHSEFPRAAETTTGSHRSDEPGAPQDRAETESVDSAGPPPASVDEDGISHGHGSPPSSEPPAQPKSTWDPPQWSPSAPEKAAPEKAAPDHAAPDHAAPDHAAPDHASSGPAAEFNSAHGAGDSSTGSGHGSPTDTDRGEVSTAEATSSQGVVATDIPSTAHDAPSEEWHAPARDVESDDPTNSWPPMQSAVPWPPPYQQSAEPPPTAIAPAVAPPPPDNNGGEALGQPISGMDSLEQALNESVVDQAADLNLYATQAPPESPTYPAAPAGPPAPLPPHLDPRVDGLVNVRRTRNRLRGGYRTEPLAVGVQVPIPSPRRISVIGLKGGVGKTTLSVSLAHVFALYRRDPVLLFDADPTYSSLPLRTGVQPVHTVHDVAAHDKNDGPETPMSYLTRSPNGAWIMPSGLSPAESASLDDPTYVSAMNSVYQMFPIMVTDCGAGLTGPLMRRIMSGSHTLVMATTPSLDGILATHNALRWIAHIGFTRLARNSLVVLTNTSRTRSPVDLEQTGQRFAPLCRGVLTVPADPHLQAGTYLDLAAMRSSTRKAVTHLASVVLDAANASG